MTKKQREEIKFLEAFKCFTGTEEQRQDYIDTTVHGKNVVASDKLSDNPYRHAKQRLNLQIDLWREDLENGLLAYWELEEDPQLQHPYAKRILDRLFRGLRQNTQPHTDHVPTAALAVVNYLSQKA